MIFETIDAPNLESLVDAIAQPFDRTDAPGVAIGVAVAGTPIYRKAFGLANLDLPIALSPAMRMRLASISKHMTSLTYLLLCENGRASLDTRIGDILPEYANATGAATARQLMGHISGVGDACDIWWHINGTGSIASSHDIGRLYETMAITSTPGETWSYNNGGYLLLSAAIERLTGQSLEDVLQERLFNPIGMRDTLLRRSDRDFLPNSASLHMERPDGGYEKSWLGDLGGEGGVVSTVDDMLLWLRHLNRPHVGSPESWRQLANPLTLNNGQSTGYGLGLMTGQHHDHAIIGHSGDTMGGSAHMATLDSGALDLIVLSNRHDVSASAFAQKILDTILPTASVLSEKNVPMLGYFRSPASGRVVELENRAGQQYVSFDGGGLPMMRRERTLRSVPELAYIQRTILLDQGDAPAGLLLTDYGTQDRLERLPPLVDEPALPMGPYRALNVDAQASIALGPDGPRLRTAGTFGMATFRLQPLAPLLWRARSVDVMPWGGILRFRENLEGFCLTTGRTRSLRFERIA